MGAMIYQLFDRYKILKIIQYSQKFSRKLFKYKNLNYWDVDNIISDILKYEFL